MKKRDKCDLPGLRNRIRASVNDSGNLEISLKSEDCKSIWEQKLGTKDVPYAEFIVDVESAALSTLKRKNLVLIPPLDSKRKFVIASVKVKRSGREIVVDRNKMWYDVKYDVREPFEELVRAGKIELKKVL